MRDIRLQNAAVVISDTLVAANTLNQLLFDSILPLIDAYVDMHEGSKENEQQ